MKTAEKQKLLEMLTSKYSVAELTELTDLLLKDRNQPTVSEGEIEKAWKNWMCTFDNFAKDEQVILEGDFHAAIKQLQSLNVQGVGACCALCGQYFVDEQDYPCVCSDCWEPSCSYPKSDADTL